MTTDLRCDSCKGMGYLTFYHNQSEECTTCGGTGQKKPVRTASSTAVKKADVLDQAISEIVDLLDGHQDFHVHELIGEIKAIAQAAKRQSIG